MRFITSLVVAVGLALATELAGLCTEVPGVKAQIEQGDLFLEEDRLDEAIDAYRRAVKTDPDSSEAHQRLGRALCLAGDLEGGLHESSRAVQIDPDSSAAHATRGWILGMLKRYREAAAEESIAYRLDQSNDAACLTLGLALASLGDYDGAIGAISQAVALEPQNVKAYVNLGAVLGRKGNYGAAITAYRKALELNPNSVAARLGLGAALGKTGDLRGQVQEFRAAVALAPHSDSAHGKLGWALYRSGDYDGAFREGCITNWIRLQRFGPQYLQSFAYIWGGLFLLFGAIFAVVFLGSTLKLHADEISIKSYFLTFLKERPGRFVITNKRIVFVPEGISKWFGARDLSINREEVREIDSIVAGIQGRLKVIMLDGEVHEFTMPVFVFKPLRSQLDKMGARARMKQAGPWVIPPEVQAAAEAMLPARPAVAGQSATAEASSQVQVAAPGQPPAGVDAAATAAEGEGEDDEEDEQIRRNTKVYRFVDGRLVEEESGEEAPLTAEMQRSAGKAERGGQPGQEAAGSVSIPDPEPPAGETSGPTGANAAGAACGPEGNPLPGKQPADDSCGGSPAEKDGSPWPPERSTGPEPEG